MPVSGPRQATAVQYQGEWGVWEPVWSAANGVKYTLELEVKAQKDDLAIDALNQRK